MSKIISVASLRLFDALEIPFFGGFFGEAASGEMALRGGAQDSFHSTLGTTRTAQFLTHLQGGTLGLPPLED